VVKRSHYYAMNTQGCEGRRWSRQWHGKIEKTAGWTL